MFRSGLFLFFRPLLYRCKKEIHSEIELTIYKLKWYSPTNIISLALLVLRLKLVLLQTEIFQYWLCLRNTPSFSPLRYRKSRATNHYTTSTFSLSFIFTLWCIGTAKFTWRQILLFMLLNNKPSLRARIWLFDCVWKSHYYYYYYYSSWEFFTSVLADGLSLEF